MPLIYQWRGHLAGLALLGAGGARAPLFTQPLRRRRLGESSLMSNDWVCLGWGQGLQWTGTGAPKADGRLPRLDLIRSVNLQELGDMLRYFEVNLS